MARGLALHVLVVDDEAVSALALASFLRRRGLRATVALGGAQAFEAHLADPADALVTDMRMPGMGGAELVRALRARDPGLPVVVVTGYSGEAAALPAERLSVVPKPVDPRDVLRAVLALAAPAAGGAAGFPVPPGEAARLAALHAQAILDTPPEEAFNRVAALASEATGAPVALVALVDAERLWFKARVGLDAAEVPRAGAFCAHAILGADVMVVEDAAADPRFRDSPLVTGDLRVRFYAAAPLLDRDGHALGTLCVIDRVPRRADPGLPALLRRLAAVAGDALELRRAVAELGRQRASLEETGRAKDAALASAGHELRTPLNAILGFSDMMRAEAFGPLGHPRYREYAGIIHEAGQHLLDMATQVLDLSRIRAGGLELAPVPTCLAAEAARVARMLAATAEAAGMALAAGGEAPAALADPVAVRQVLVNLASNALKYGRPGGRAAITVAAADGGVAAVVSDDGPGIAPHHLARLGEPFYRGAEAGGRQPGLGLGLAICRQLAAAMGGTLTLESEPGAGTRATLWLPAAPP